MAVFQSYIFWGIKTKLKEAEGKTGHSLLTMINYWDTFEEMDSSHKRK